LWQRPDQRGYEALEQQQAERAAELFENREWRGAAQYRAGRFSESASSLAGIDTAEGNYNRGNALAKAGRLEDAIGAYDRAIELDPGHADAIYNRDLLKDYLEKNPEQKQQNQPQSGGEQSQQRPGDSSGSNGSDESASGEASQSDSQGSDEQQSNAQSQDGQGQGPDDQGQQGDDEANQAEQQADDQSQQAQGDAAGPDDVEQWASEQAADQWLRRIPQDPGGLLRRKFLYQYQRLGVDQDGKSVARDPQQAKPW
jgi:Ca-activated chloride channel family protein